MAEAELMAKGIDKLKGLSSETQLFGGVLTTVLALLANPDTRKEISKGYRLIQTVSDERINGWVSMSS